jgi:hypothetical protein
VLFQHKAYWLSKDAQDPHAYEDAFEVDGAQGVAVICDGVSSSLFSGRWAALIAKAVVAEPPAVRNPEALEAWLKKHREAWAASIDESSLAWHQKPKLLDGAATTVLWVELATTGHGDSVARPYRLRGYACGDCCLFHIRDCDVLQMFPLQESARFETNPPVLRSVYKRADVLTFEALETQCHPDDLVVLCTDAVGAWVMRQLEAGVQLDWEAFWNTSPEEWQRWLIEVRQGGQIRFDDSTMLMLRIGGRRPTRVQPRKASDEGLLDVAEDKLRGALKSIKGSLRKGLKELAESKWLKEKDGSGGGK